MNPQVTSDQHSTVRKMLEELAPCETGYAGTAPCKTCAMCYPCADAVNQALTGLYPETDWAPAIREVLGLW